MPDMVETECFFPVKGETPMCSDTDRLLMFYLYIYIFFHPYRNHQESKVYIYIPFNFFVVR
jgi:hypothetical protein